MFKSPLSSGGHVVGGHLGGIPYGGIFISAAGGKFYMQKFHNQGVNSNPFSESGYRVNNPPIQIFCREFALFWVYSTLGGPVPPKDRQG